MGRLKHSPADILRYLLVAKGVGTLPSNRGVCPVFVGQEPDQPDLCITVYDTDGRDDGRDMVTGRKAEHYGVQVRVRAVAPPDAFAKARDVFEAVNETLYREVVGIDNTTYCVQSVSTTGSINTSGKSGDSLRSTSTFNAFICIGG